MALIDRLKPSYDVNMVCDNCGKKCTIRIKKGMTVTEAIRNKEIVCDNCRCILKPREYTTQWLK